MFIRNKFTLKGINSKKNEIKLWDPFCGSGTILLETFGNYFRLPITKCF